MSLENITGCFFPAFFVLVLVLGCYFFFSTFAINVLVGFFFFFFFLIFVLVFLLIFLISNVSRSSVRQGLTLGGSNLETFDSIKSPKFYYLLYR